jgi:hypothetical protein
MDPSNTARIVVDDMLEMILFFPAVAAGVWFAVSLKPTNVSCGFRALPGHQCLRYISTPPCLGGREACLVRHSHTIALVGYDITACARTGHHLERASHKARW